MITQPTQSLSSRRTLLKRASMLGVGALAAQSSMVTHAQEPAPASDHGIKPEFCLFTKHLLGMEPAALADHAASLGFAGLEAPIRPGGHIEPERVADELPAFVDTLAKARIKLTILTSGINAVDPAQHTEPILRTAAKSGVKYYRLNWFKYDLKQPLLPQLGEIRAKIKDLIALSHELGIQPLSQNHNGPDYVGASIWDLESVMRDFAPADWGFAYDIMHATVVGGTSWQIGYQLARPRIGAACFKDFIWSGKLKPRACPLGEGMAAGQEYARLLRESQFSGPISLHVEYLQARKISNAGEASIAHEAAAADFSTLRKWLGA